jgi:peptide/nickel transport system substrate-binding protein
LTSRDVAFTYRAIVNPANIIPSRYGYDQVAAVDTPDTLTVVVRLKRPYSPIISYFFGGDSNYPVLPAHLLASLPNLNHAAFNEAPVGSGPFAFARWSRGDAIETKANATYYAGRPGLDGVTLRFVHDSSTTIAQLTTHEVDAAFATDVARIDELRAVPNHRVVVTPVPYFYAVLFNVTDPLLSDGAVRHAFALAIDRRSLVGKVTHGLYDPDTGMRGLFTWAFDPRAGNVPYDPRAAADLLSRDGWIPGPDGIRVKSGRRLEIQLATRTGMQIDSEFAVIVAAQERAVGIDVEQKRYSPEQFFATDGPIMQGRYQAGIYGYQSSYDPDVSWLLACSQRGPNGFNDARYCNAAVDRALRDGSSSFDRASRMRDYAFVQRQILADLPYDFLCQTSQIDVIPTNLEGYDPPLLSPFTSIARWRLR